jgi:hypothetical protein
MVFFFGRAVHTACVEYLLFDSCHNFLHLISRAFQRTKNTKPLFYHLLYFLTCFDATTLHDDFVLRSWLAQRSVFWDSIWREF